MTQSNGYVWFLPGWFKDRWYDIDYLRVCICICFCFCICICISVQPLWLCNCPGKEKEGWCAREKGWLCKILTELCAGNTDGYGQLWPRMDKYGQIWTNMDKYGQICANMDECWSRWRSWTFLLTAQRQRCSPPWWTSYCDHYHNNLIWSPPWWPSLSLSSYWRP